MSYMNRTRQCAHCNNGTMHPVSREMQVYNSVYRYKCKSCGAETEITPYASIGIALTVGLLALSFWGYILFGGTTFELIWLTGKIELAIYVCAVLVWLVVNYIPLSKHMLYPVNGSVQSPEAVPVSNADHIAARAILWLEKSGLIIGMLMPILVILAVLGTATLIGYINFTYF